MTPFRKFIVVYYFVLYLALLFTWARETAIPMPLRSAFVALVFIPILISNISYYYPCLVLFLTTSLLSYAGYTFMPTEPLIYLLITVIFAGFAIREQRNYRFPYHLFILLIVLTVVVNLIGSGKLERVSYSLLIMSLIPVTISGKNWRTIVTILPRVFIVSTVCVAILTLLNQQLFIRETYDYERLISGSLNYTCCSLGIGFVFAMREFIDSSTMKLWRVASAASMVVLLITILMEASRGAMLAIAIATILTVFRRSSRLGTKVLIVLFTILVVVVLYNNHFFDLLIYRIQSDDGSGTGRTDIWSDKLNSFINSITIYSGLFGIGYEQTWDLGGGGHSYIGCHNDFIAFFIEYGLIGLLFFLVLIGYPLFAAKTKDVRADIIPLLAYLIVVSFSLEPFSMGYMPFCFLLLFIYIRVCGPLIVKA